MFALAAHIHAHLHHLHPSTIDYAGLAIAAWVSWIGFFGPGEPVLIATGVLAAKHHLGIVSVLVVAWAAATGGGIAGWLLGIRAGRGLVTGPGPLRRHRERAVERGDRLFARYPVLAIIVLPTWIAGIHRVPPPVFLVTNVLFAAFWASAIGLGAYYIGPAVIHFVDDFGTLSGAVAATLIISAIGGELLLRRRRRAAHPYAGDDS